MPLFLLLWRWYHWIKLESRFAQFHRTARGERIRKESIRRSQEYIKATAPTEYWHILLPDYEGTCKRITADFGYLEYLNAPNMEFVGDAAADVDRTGVVTASGKQCMADIIVSTQ